MAYENVGVSLSDAIKALANQKVRIFANGSVETRKMCRQCRHIT